MQNWSNPTTNAEAARRASGRRHYNSLRQFKARRRQAEVIKMVNNGGGLFDWGVQTRIAEALGVSRATVCRDMKELLKRGHACPTCGTYSRTG